MNWLKGIAAHLILSFPDIPYLTGTCWWVDHPEIWALETCWNLHGERCWTVVDDMGTAIR